MVGKHTCYYEIRIDLLVLGPNLSLYCYAPDERTVCWQSMASWSVEGLLKETLVKRKGTGSDRLRRKG